MVCMVSVTFFLLDGLYFDRSQVNIYSNLTKRSRVLLFNIHTASILLGTIRRHTNIRFMRWLERECFEGLGVLKCPICVVRLAFLIQTEWTFSLLGEDSCCGTCVIWPTLICWFVCTLFFHRNLFLYFEGSENWQCISPASFLSSVFLDSGFPSFAGVHWFMRFGIFPLPILIYYIHRW